MLRKVVTNGTAGLSDVEGYEVGGKTGTAQIVENGLYTKKKLTPSTRSISNFRPQVCFSCFIRRYKTF